MLLQESRLRSNIPLELESIGKSVWVNLSEVYIARELGSVVTFSFVDNAFTLSTLVEEDFGVGVLRASAFVSGGVQSIAH